MIDRALANDKDLADVQEFLPQNAVQLMTIHKSKGLEFKYVFLMNIDKRFNLEDHYRVSHHQPEKWSRHSIFSGYER